jgi:hypothetical protein
VTNGRFAAFIGEYDTQGGVLMVKQEGDKLFADAGGQRMDLVPENQADKFTAQPAGASVTFIRDASGKVTEVLVVMGGGREMKGRKIN